MVRMFIACPTPLALQQSAQEVRTILHTSTFPWRWMQPAQLHVTLKFFGEVATERTPDIAGAMERSVQRVSSFVLQARTLGCFPNALCPRVLWMGLDDPEQRLSQLAQRLQDECARVGFAPEERSFRPHLTLARSQQARSDTQLRTLLQTYQDHVWGEFYVMQILLVQSHLTPGGAVYSSLHMATLQN